VKQKTKNDEFQIKNSSLSGTVLRWPAWNNKYSNTVFSRRPSEDIVNTYILAQGNDENFGGKLAHIVVMQHVTKEKIDQFISALQAEAGPAK